MNLPLGLTVTRPNTVCKLLKSSYGLKQASQQRFAKMSHALIDYGFAQGNSNCSLFVKQTHASFIALLIYVDDILLTNDSLLEIQYLKTFLHNKFTIKDMGQLKYFLGLEIDKSWSRISICKKKYALGILQDTSLLNSKPVVFPMESNLKLTSLDSNLYEDPSTYRRLIDRLLYLTIIRLDLAYAIQVLSLYCQTSCFSSLNCCYSTKIFEGNIRTRPLLPFLFRFAT